MIIPDIQQYLLYSSQFFLGMGFMTSFFISVSGRPQNKNAKTAIFFIAIFTVLLSSIFLYLFISRPKEIILWSQVDKSMVGVFIIITAFVMLAAGKKHVENENAGGIYIMLFALSAAVIYGNIIILAGAFITFDFVCFLNMAGNKNQNTSVLTRNKYFYFLGILFFAGVFIALRENTKYAKMSLTAIIIFLVFFSTPANMVLLTSEKKTFNGFTALCSAAEAVIIYRIVSLYGGFVIIEALIPIILVFLCLSAFNTITEEKYFAFAAGDMASAFLLVVAFAVALKPAAGGIIAVVALILIQGIILSDFFDEPNNQASGYKVSDVRYNFKKIKNSAWLIVNMTSMLAIEIYIFTMFYLKFKANSFISAITLFGGAVYAINMLNKIFILLSMMKRTDARMIKNSLNSRIIVKIVLFAALIAALAAQVMI